MQINQWQLRYFDYFAAKLTELEQEVTQLRSRDPEGYKSHPQTKLLASLYHCVLERVPRDPTHREFWLGNTLGQTNRHWRRVKQGMPHRYRLFFQFGSMPVKTIVYVWYNDPQTLRKAGAKTDVYEVFKKLLAAGEIPSSLAELIKRSQEW
jgi:toxin YhaV